MKKKGLKHRIIDNYLVSNVGTEYSLRMKVFLKSTHPLLELALEMLAILFAPSLEMLASD